MFPIKTILHPTDLSDSSRCAFALASSLAGAQGSRLVVLHVNRHAGPPVAFGAPLGTPPRDEYKEKLSEILHRFRGADPKAPVEYLLAEGNVPETILRVADETGCDLIVMGSHGRSLLGQVLKGSVAKEVVRKARCAVVTVRAPRPAGPVVPPAHVHETGSPAELGSGHP
jgi:nucleotide-binding universal stress UspA family protein